jgi:hypothetical protein
MIIAKPVLKNEFWILRQDQKKIGNIESLGDGYAVRINNQIVKIKNINAIKNTTDVVFEKISVTKSRTPKSVYGYETGCPIYNPVWDLKRRLPLFTKQRNSKSWFAAGWYAIQQKNVWQVAHNPKLISVKRYQYHGPYQTAVAAEEKKSQLNISTSSSISDCTSNVNG